MTEDDARTVITFIFDLWSSRKGDGVWNETETKTILDAMVKLPITVDQAKKRLNTFKLSHTTYPTVAHIWLCLKEVAASAIPPEDATESKLHHEKELKRIRGCYPKRSDLQAVRCWLEEAAERSVRLRGWIPPSFRTDFENTLVNLAKIPERDAAGIVQEVLSIHPTIPPRPSQMTQAQKDFKNFDSLRNREAAIKDAEATAKA